MDGGTHPVVDTTGWFIGEDTYQFHRHFVATTGRPARHREYSDLLWQIRTGRAERLYRYVYRVTLADDQKLIVKGGRQVLRAILPPDWQAPVAALGQKRDAPRPLKPTTLTLGAGGTKDAAAKVLTRHLTKIGISTTEVIRSNKSARR